MESLHCPLCNGASTHYHTQKQREFLKCTNCRSVFLNPAHYITPAEEKTHYEWHNNDPEDVRYQNFVSPIVNSILADFEPHHYGLDFGSGTGSPIMKLLKDNYFNIREYDLFFHNEPALLQQKYHYIACSETAEHFKEPRREFSQLRDMLLPDGKLFIMTELHNEHHDFATWYYKDDPTHVFFYHKNAFEWIKAEFGFENVKFDGRLTVLSL